MKYLETFRIHFVPKFVWNNVLLIEIGGTPKIVGKWQSMNRSMNAVGPVQSKWCLKGFTFMRGAHCVQTSMNLRRNEIHVLYSYFYNPFTQDFQDFCVKSANYMAQTYFNAFGHYVQQPSSTGDVNQTFRQPVKTFVYPWLRLTTKSHDQLTFIDVLYEPFWTKIGSSKESLWQCKY